MSTAPLIMLMAKSQVIDNSFYGSDIHQQHQLLDIEIPHNDINNNSRTPQKAKQKIEGRHTVTKAITSTN